MRIPIACFALVAYWRSTSATIPTLCSYHEPGKSLVCGASHILPDNFDVDQIPIDVQSLHMGTIVPGVIVLAPNFLPVPPRPSLTSCVLLGFVSRDQRNVPINEFLVNVKHQLTYLRITHARLPSITRNTLAGFVALQHLELAANGVEDIAADTFTLLQPAHLHLTPALSILHLDYNLIRKLDIATFLPVAPTLRTLVLQKNELDHIYASKPVFFPNLSVLYLNDNKLRTISSALLESLNESVVAHFSAHNNPTCAADNQCRCCSTEHMLNWLHKTPATFPVIFDCGTGPLCKEGAPAIGCTKRYSREKVVNLLQNGVCLDNNLEQSNATVPSCPPPPKCPKFSFFSPPQSAAVQKGTNSKHSLQVI